MNQFKKIVVLTLVAAFSVAAPSSNKSASSLEDEMTKLNIPTNQMPNSVPSESLYAVQTRLYPLQYRHELSIGMGKNFSVEGYLGSQEFDAAYRFYLNERMFLGLSGNYVSTSFNQVGLDQLKTTGTLVQEIAYAKYKVDLMAGFHIFYGKFRVSLDQVFYFDLYAALGPAYFGMANVSYNYNTFGAAGDLGFVFWFGKHFTGRLGGKTYAFNAKTTRTEGLAFNILGHFDIGYVF